MPLALNNPETVTIGTVKITSFAVQIEPLLVTIHYERGVNLDAGGFQVIDAGSVQFDQQEVAQADPASTVYSRVKAVLYELLQLRLGSGSIQ